MELRTNWVSEKSGLVLKVPSSIIAQEFNYIVHPQHQDVPLLKINKISLFLFDNRLA